MTSPQPCGTDGIVPSLPVEPFSFKDKIESANETSLL